MLQARLEIGGFLLGGALGHQKLLQGSCHLAEFLLSLLEGLAGLGDLVGLHAEGSPRRGDLSSQVPQVATSLLKGILGGGWR